MLVLGVAFLSARPMWQSLPEGTGLVRLSLTHSGVRNCRARTAQELADLPANMRDREVCERRRAPIRIEMDIDGQQVFATEAAPSGLAGSGPSRIYQRIELPTGPYHVTLRLADDPSVAGFAYEAGFDINLQAAQSIAIDFDAASDGFYLH
ncbi:hypothetical protein thalar_02889 [Litoreibacter arenae DSM 19593]|uniref:Uncharacterized protein n=1 Tax=Litoreibacter arenae DSM 19593 TaxID=1123360 RepID=S9QC61_9RHOB|nr:hypothetical protein thalar_02889 [Litoreibacter arenae DSM 19593]